jgi:DNA-binding Lrp family transcriptional regulator
MLERETLTAREVADALGCPFSTAQSRLQELRRAGRIGLYQNAGVAMWFAVDRSPKPTPAPVYDFVLVIPENL